MVEWELIKENDIRGWIRKGSTLKELVVSGELANCLQSSVEIKSGKRAVVRQMVSPCTGSEYYVKQFSIKSVPEYTLYWLGKDRARSLHKTSLLLHEKNISTAQSEACLYIQGEEGLKACWFSLPACGKSLQNWYGDSSASGRERVVRAAVKLLHSMHSSGFSHGDYKWGNIFYSESSECCTIIDIDSVKRKSKFYDQRAARDIARFLLNTQEAGVGKDECESVLDYYSELLGLPVNDVKKRMRPILIKLQHRHLERYGKDRRVQL